MGGAYVERGCRGAARRAAPKILAALLVASSAATAAECSIGQIAELPLDERATVLITRGEINGHPVRILLDTGAEHSILWRPAAERLGLHLITGPRMHLYGLGGESRVDSAVIDSLQLDRFTARGLRFAVAGDLDTNFDLVLGADFLFATSLEFDVPHHTLRLIEPHDCPIERLAYWAKTYSMADLVASPHAAKKIETEVVLNTKRIRARLDSGASFSIVSMSAATAAGVGRPAQAGEIVGVGQQRLESWVGVFDRFGIGDEAIRNAQLRMAVLDRNARRVRVGSRIPEIAIELPVMLLGADFLRAHRILVDNTSGKMVFTYEGGPVFRTRPPETRSAEPGSPSQDAAEHDGGS